MQLFHPPILSAKPTIVYDTTQLDTNLGSSIVFDLGVTDPIQVDVIVASGVILGASSTSSWGLDFNSVPAGSVVTLIVIGRIQGAGGAGGDAAASTSQNFASGGGGGGQGSNPGAGGLGGNYPADPVSDAADGTTEAGGAAGIADTFVPAQRTYVIDNGFTQNGDDGGDALRTLNIGTLVINYGEIWGGGGGGGAGGLSAGDLERWDGGAGGGAGEAGTNSPQETGPPAGGNAPISIAYGVGGAAGAAIRGNFVTIVTGGSSPNIEGAVTSWP